MRISKILLFFGTLGLLSLSLLLPQWVAGQPPAGPKLRLHRGEIDAQTGPRLGQRFTTLSALAASVPGPYAIIQFKGPITPRNRQTLIDSGVTILEYLPDYAYLVKGGPTQLDQAARLSDVYGRADFTLADKLSPALLRAAARGDNNLGLVRIFGWPDDQGALSQALRALNIGPQPNADLALVLQLAALEPVRWIEPATQPQLVNDYARDIMNVDPVWQHQQLFGAGQVIAVADTGLDTGDLGTLSPDFAGRIVATHVLSAGGDWADDHGHGTHVAGSVASAGIQSGANPGQRIYTNSFAGVAPEAELVIQGFEATEAGEIIGLDPDYYQLLAQAYTDGARLHSNSWGDPTGPLTGTAAAYGGYPFGTMRIDEFIWQHPDMAVFFAAGNAGKDGTAVDFFGIPICLLDGDGVIDVDSLFAPGTAKNVITVGASESNRTSGGYGGNRWSDISFCAQLPPLSSDLLSDNTEGMAAFSSRGPADDGRIKPDLVAPGTNIVSNHSQQAGASTLWGIHETNTNYAYSGGTSMATPLAAGAGALVRQWLGGHGFGTPSAAAIKTTLLNTTYDMAPGQYGLGLTQEIPFTQANSVAGWGRLDLAFIGAPAPYLLWLDDHTAGLSTGQVVSYSHTLSRPLTVVTNTQPLRVMLTWTDPPASLSAQVQLVNDLDLTVVGPGGVTYYGNGVVSGDRTNNVEGIVIDNPPLGRYEIGVSGFNIPIASQPYALAVAGPLQDQSVGTPGLTVLKTASSATAEVGQTITYTYLVSNSGSITLTGLSGLDDKLGPVSFSPNTLLPAQIATATLTYTVQANDIPGPLLNTVTISATAQQGGQTVQDVDATSVVLRYIDLALSKSVNDLTLSENGFITYTIGVSYQDGTVDPATGIVISDTLPPNVALSGSTATQGSYDGALWNVGTVTAGSTAYLTVTGEVVTGTIGLTITNTASLSNVDQFETNSSNNQASAAVTLAQPDLTVSKTVDQQTLLEGSNLIYTIVVTSQNASASGVVISDVLPAGVSYLGALVSQGVYSEATGLWDVGDLLIGNPATLILSARVGVGTSGQTITNTAEVASLNQMETTPANNQASAAFTVATFDLGVFKTVSDQTPLEGDTIVYTIVVTNQGASASGVVISDVLPAGVSYLAALGSQGVYDNISGIWNVGSLPIDGLATLTILVTVNIGTSGQTITNTAVVEALDQADTNASNNTSGIALSVVSGDATIYLPLILKRLP